VTGAAGDNDAVHKDIAEDDAATYDDEGASIAASLLGDAKAKAGDRTATSISRLMYTTTTMSGTTTRPRTMTTSTMKTSRTTTCREWHCNWAGTIANRAKMPA